MSHVSTGVEYALHCLLYLATPLPGNAAAGVRDLAHLQGLPSPYLAKLFTKLHKAGLVNGIEGVRGGFALARPAAHITVLEVVTAVDGAKPLFECTEIRTRCLLFGDTAPSWATKGACSIHQVMRDAEDRMRETLAAVTLADLAAKVSAKAPRSFDAQVVKWLGERAGNRRVSPSAAAKRVPSLRRRP